MPTYQYACTACDHRFETVQSFTEDSLTECPECTGKLRKLYGAVGVVFKGSGFYRNDSRAESSGKSSASKSGSATSGASGSGDSGSSATSNGSGSNGSSESSSSGNSSDSGSGKATSTPSTAKAAS